MSIDIPILETERFIMRGHMESDFESEAEFYATDASRFVGGPMTRELLWRSFASLIGHWVLRGYGFWALEERNTGAYLGRVGLWFPEGWPEPELGWTLMPSAQGKGYATQAAIQTRDYAYTKLGWKTAISLIDPDNKPSIALAKRLGASEDGTYQHERYGLMHIWRHPSPEVVL